MGPFESSRYFYVDAERKPQGPLGFEELESLEREGVIKRGTLVIREGESDYMKWRDIVELVSNERMAAHLRPDPGEAESERTGPGTPILKPEMFKKLDERYRQAYRVAGVVNGTGGFFHGLGIFLCVVGGLALMLVLIGSSSGDLGIPAFILLPLGGGGLAVGAVLLVGGMAVQGIGQMLTAQIDTAINTSPVLTPRERASIMHLDQ